ncbi:hypothetical protein R2K36_32920, partial [Pseudomonas aeruginosa]|uniref:hypothetical protein n=1 Tax=Pseudomonas aeruginosa TaxID=287 RepID=UPI00396F3D69
FCDSIPAESVYCGGGWLAHPRSKASVVNISYRPGIPPKGVFPPDARTLASFAGHCDRLCANGLRHPARAR